MSDRDAMGEHGRESDGAVSHDREAMSRRTVLTGLGAVGLAGAFGGLGTRALAADSEPVEGFLQAGTIDLQLCWEDDERTDCVPESDTGVTFPITVSERGDSGSVSIRCLLAETDEANPGYLWFRTNCPDDACGIEDALEVTLWYDVDCDGTRDGSERLIERGSLCEVLSNLHEGVVLDGNLDTDEPDAVLPGDSCCIGLEWSLDADLCERDTVDLQFEFRAEQERHTMDLVSPWEGTECTVDCSDDCVQCLDLAGMSFVAFCGPEDLTPDDLTLTTTAINFDAETVGLDWTCSKQVERVVVKLGNGASRNRRNDGGGHFAMYEFSGPAEIELLADGGSRGSVRSDLGSLVIDGEPWNPCPDPNHDGVKYEFDERRWERV